MHKKIMLTLGLAFAITGVLTGCSPKEENKVTISAAASLREPLDEIKKDFENKNDVNVYINYGPSGTLRKQIEEGAEVDIFISASQEFMENLKDKKLISNKVEEDMIQNSLVLIKRKDVNINSLEDINKKDYKIAIGEVETAPVGQYTKETLKNLNYWDKLSKNMIMAKDAGAIVSYCRQDEVDLAFIYKSDFRNLKNWEIYKEFGDNYHTKINYPIAILKGSEDDKYIDDFYNKLVSDESKNIFMKYKFNVEDK
jgi:molybdate transport system substrate-binding protein